MPTINRFADLHDEITAWRRDIHENPELLFDVHRTASLVEEKLKAFGCDEVVPGIGRTGVVGIIRGKNGGAGRTIGLRADMDALPMNEATGRSLAFSEAARSMLSPSASWPSSSMRRRPASVSATAARVSSSMELANVAREVAPIAGSAMTIVMRIAGS